MHEKYTQQVKNKKDAKNPNIGSSYNYSLFLVVYAVYMGLVLYNVIPFSASDVLVLRIVAVLLIPITAKTCKNFFANILITVYVTGVYFLQVFLRLGGYSLNL